MHRIWRLLVLSMITLALSANDDDNFSDEFIREVNKKATTWKAGSNFHPNTSKSLFRGLMGVHPDSTNFPQQLKLFNNRRGDLPENFDSRTNCPTIGENRNQGTCASCWAFGAVEALSDRECIHSGGESNFRYSAEDLAACCHTCGFGCNGCVLCIRQSFIGFAADAWSYWVKRGIVSGGSYGSEDGCLPYKVAPCDHQQQHHVNGTRNPCKGEYRKTPKCEKKCQARYKVPHEKNKHFGKISYSINNNEYDIRQEIFENGPVVAFSGMFDDWFSYKNGVYQHVHGDYAGKHVIRIVGWGVENGTKYWLIANSFNTDWGDNGYFKILCESFVKFFVDKENLLQKCELWETWIGEMNSIRNNKLL